MLVTRGTPAVALPAVALAIGNFDGVHIGHQAILARVRAEAARRGLAAALLTFEPHPREVFEPGTAPTRLTSLREKLEMLSAFGMDRVHVQRFSPEFAALAPQAFVENLLVGTLKVRWLLVGSDFRYGAKRAGDVALLQALGSRHGFEVEKSPTIESGGARVSSSAGRAARSAGDLPAARVLLGRHYRMSGRVAHGDKLGRTLGFPTANVQMQHNRPPLAGIFAVLAHGVRERVSGSFGGATAGALMSNGDASGWPGVASLGVRPTVKANGQPVLEVHLFDFQGDIYGSHLRVEFLHKIRDEAKYPDLATLTAQIARDCEAARQYLERGAA